MSIPELRLQGDPAPYPILCKTCPATGPSDPSPPPSAPLPTSPAFSRRRTAGEGRRCSASCLRTAPPTPVPTATLLAPRLPQERLHRGAAPPDSPPGRP